MEYLFFFYFFIFLFGLTVGSFLNSIIFRLQTGESFLIKRSYCPFCQHILAWQDLIPVFSFLILRGKCRYCHQKISWQYPLVELATGVLFVLILHHSLNQLSIINYQLLLFIIYHLLIASFLIIIFVIDLKHYIIPDKIIYPAIGIALLYRLFGIWNFKTLINPLASAFLASVFFLLIYLISQGKWMGFGDVKLAFLLGLFLGFPKILIALFLAFFLGGLIGSILVLSGRKTLKSPVPFAPFLIVGTLLAFFWGDIIFDMIIVI